MMRSLEDAGPVSAADPDAGVRLDVMLAAAVVAGAIVLRLMWLVVLASRR